MESPRGALTLQRALTALLLAAVAVVAAVEHVSPLAARIHDRKPWAFWMTAAREGLIPVHLGIYNPLRRTLVLIRFPEATRRDGKLTLDRAQRKISVLAPELVDAENLALLRCELGPTGDDEPEVSAIRSLWTRGQSLHTLASLFGEAARGLMHGDKTAADPLLLALELRRVAADRLEPALLPDDSAAPAFLAHVFSPAPAAEEARIPVIEVLNGSGRQGLAAQAAKMLRSRGLDVISLGVTARARVRTVVYDRIGDFSGAARVRAALGCPQATATTHIDGLRGVDVSVELGSDCLNF